MFNQGTKAGITKMTKKIAIRKRERFVKGVNPIALALSEAKNYNLTIEEIFTRVKELEKKYDHALYQPEAMAQSDEVHLIFHPRTLAQLC